MMKKTLKIILLASIGIIPIAFFFAAYQLAHAQSATIEVLLSTFVNPITQYTFSLFKQLITGLLYLLAAAALLNISINATPEMLDLNNSLFVKTGLNVTTALADILLIVVFIAIALGTVFNVESINAKKHLVKFFFAALLIHFAPLFVGMLLDVSNILTASLMVGNGDIFSSVFNTFFTSAATSAFALGAIYSAGAVAASVIGLNVLAMLGLVLGMFAFMVGVVPHYLIQIMVMETLTGILFSYAMFFLTRVFMIQILAVLAPLAILASVLPQTNRHFKTWMDWLIGWCLGGIVMLFLLTLGLSSSKMIMPSDIQYTPFTFSTYAISTITSFHFYWIALAIYMLAAQAICAGMIPALSGDITKKVTGGMGEAGKKMGQGLWNKKQGNYQEKISDELNRNALNAKGEYESTVHNASALRR